MSIIPLVGYQDHSKVNRIPLSIDSMNRHFGLSIQSLPNLAQAGSQDVKIPKQLVGYRKDLRLGNKAQTFVNRT